MAPDTELGLRLERERYAAMRRNDADALGTVLSDDLIYVHSNGQIDTKDSYLSKVRDGRLRYLDIERTEKTVTTSGGTVVILGRMLADIVLNGESKSIDNHHIVVWAEDAGRWSMLAHSPTPSEVSPAK